MELDEDVRVWVEGHGQRVELVPGGTVVFGRAASDGPHVRIGAKDLGVSRVAGEVQRRGGTLWLRNRGRTPVRLLDPERRAPLTVPSGTELAPGWTKFHLQVTGERAEPYELVVEAKVLERGLVTERPMSADGTATRVVSLPVDTLKFYVLLALAEPSLRAPDGPYIPSDTEVRTRLQPWITSPKFAVRTYVDALARDLKVPVDPERPSKVRQDVVRRAIEAGVVTTASLARLA